MKSIETEMTLRGMVLRHGDAPVGPSPREVEMLAELVTERRRLATRVKELDAGIALHRRSIRHALALEKKMVAQERREARAAEADETKKARSKEILTRLLKKDKNGHQRPNT
jgi:hypothetical protein